MWFAYLEIKLAFWKQGDISSVRLLANTIVSLNCWHILELYRARLIWGGQIRASGIITLPSSPQHVLFMIKRRSVFP